MAAFTTKEDVRAYLGTQASQGKWTDDQVDAAIAAAASYLQTKTSRQFELQDAVTKTFTTHGAASVTIPDLQSVTEVRRDDAVLTEKSGYWLLPDTRTSGIFTGIQLRAYGGNLAYSKEAWDRNLDPAGMGYGRYIGSYPNDLEVDGTWGYNASTPAPVIPDEVEFANKVLAAFYVLRPDSVLGNVSVTPEGAIRSYTALPIEVRAFIEEWTLGQQAALI